MSDQSSLSVIFKRSCDAAASSCEVSLELDDVLNGGSTTFEIGNKIFYRAYPAADYKCYTSRGGTMVVECAYKTASLTEEVSFSGSSEASLSHPLAGSFSFSWIGNALAATFPHSKIRPNIKAANGSTTITASEAVYGVVSVTYEYSYASLSFSPVNTGRQIVLVCRTCDSGEEGCAYREEEVGSVSFENVVLVITDACDSNFKVAGAQVVLNGELVDSVSDADGRINLGLLAKGVHSIRVTAPGYTPSNEDSLSNDTIEVE